MQAVREEDKQEEQQDDVVTYRLVEDLQSVGINMSEIKKLQDAGLATIGSVLQRPMKELVAIKGFSEGAYERLLAMLFRSCGVFNEILTFSPFCASFSSDVSPLSYRCCSPR